MSTLSQETIGELVGVQGYLAAWLQNVRQGLTPPADTGTAIAWLLASLQEKTGFDVPELMYWDSVWEDCRIEAPAETPCHVVHTVAAELRLDQLRSQKIETIAQHNQRKGTR